MSELILELCNVSKRYPEFNLSKINLQLPRGYVMGFIGQNGAGKSTTIKSILNLIQRDEGEIRIFGQRMEDAEMEIKNKLGFVGENQYFYEDVSVNWLISFFKKIYQRWDDQYCQQLLSKFRISRTKKVETLSKGMRVKLAIALALAHDAELLILDEPTSSLDPAARYDVLQEILALIKNENKSVFFSSHITEDIEKVADYLTFIDNGKILFSGEKDLILERYKKVLFTLPDESQLEQIRTEFVSFKKIGSSCLGIIEQVERLKKYRLNQMEMKQVGLEEIFLAHVRGDVL